jgi:hypothetical protein
VSGPETALVGRMKRAIVQRWPDAWTLKVHGSTYQAGGVPDLLVLTGSCLVSLEVKAPRPGESHDHARSRCTALQRVRIAQVRRAGGTAGCVVTVDEALSLVEWALTLNERSPLTPSERSTLSPVPDPLP